MSMLFNKLCFLLPILLLLSIACHIRPTIFLGGWKCISKEILNYLSLRELPDENERGMCMRLKHYKSSNKCYLTLLKLSNHITETYLISLLNKGSWETEYSPQEKIARLLLFYYIAYAYFRKWSVFKPGCGLPRQLVVCCAR